MVVSAMVAGMGLTFAVVLRTEARGWQTRENQMTTSSELRRGIQSMARELAQTSSSQVTSPPADGNSYTSISFSVPEDRDGNGTVLNAITGALEWSLNPITYNLVGVNGGSQQLQRTQGGVVSPLAYGVTALSFRRQAATPSVLEMNVTVQRGAADGAQPVTLSTRVRLRN